MRAECAQNAPHGSETLVVVEHRGGIGAGGNGHRQHDVAVRLAGRLAHRAPHGLDDVHVGVARAHEQHRVEGRHVDALGQTAGVREDPAGVSGVSLQPLDPRLAVQCMVPAVHVLRLAAQCGLALLFGQLRGSLLHDPGPVPVQPSGREDRVGEGDRPAQRPDPHLSRRPVLRVLERPPAADDLRRIVEVDLAVDRLQVLPKRPVDPLLRHREHDHLVIREQVQLDGAGERQPVELGAVSRLVVHREDLDRVVGRLPFRALGVEPRRRGHVQTSRGQDPLPVVNQNEG